MADDDIYVVVMNAIQADMDSDEEGSLGELGYKTLRQAGATPFDLDKIGMLPAIDISLPLDAPDQRMSDETSKGKVEVPIQFWDPDVMRMRQAKLRMNFVLRDVFYKPWRGRALLPLRQQGDMLLGPYPISAGRSVYQLTVYYRQLSHVPS